MHNFTDTKEEQRLKALREYNIQESYVDFDFILESIAKICEVPLCNIVAAYKDELFIIASTGIKIKKQHKREGSCTNFTLKKNKFCEVRDIKEEEGILDKTYMIEDFDIRFYAGSPLIDPEGNTLGSLNLYDDKPRVLNEDQKYFINTAAVRIVTLFLQKRQKQRLLLFDNMFSKSKDVIGIINFTGEIERINPAFSALTGYDEKDILRTNMLDYIHPDYLEEAESLLSILKNGKSKMNYTLPTITKDDTVKWIEWTSTPEQSTELIYFIGRDITTTKEQSKLLKLSEERFRGFFQNSLSLLCIHDLEGTIIAVNNAAATIVGISKKAFVGRKISSFLPKNRQPYFNVYLKELNEKGIAQGNTETIGLDGEKRYWLYNSIVEENGYRKAYVLTNGIDLTERYKMEHELKVATKKSEEANRAKSEFIANMSHEIRTPLNGIIGFTDLVLKTPLDETQQQYLKIINQSGATLLNIVDQILDFSKIESRRITLMEEKIDLQNLASDACAMVSYASEKKGLEMLLDFNESLPRYIWGDEIRLKQVLVNLLGNAVKFTEKGEIKLSLVLKEDLPDNQIVLHFEVSDTGIGIQPEKMNQIFKAFTQEDSSITKKYGGTGLGLTISNKLLELMDSKLELKSEIGKGSSFSFDLTLKAEQENFDDELLKGIKRMLVVDDNDSNRQILKRMLELKNIHVDEADSGLSALLMLQKNAEYDVIIMDYHMPVMDGIETIRKIKDIIKGNSDQPIVMLYSSSDDDHLQSACDELEVESRLVKPIKMQEMYHVLAQLKNENLKKEHKKKHKATDLKELDGAYETPSTILIVEDNEINLYLSKVLVAKIVPKSIILEARDGLEAVRLFTDNKPDLILMDIQMPTMNGIEATQEIRKLETDTKVPIIALTAGNISGEKDRCLAAGMNDFMVKPIVKKELSKLFKKWLKSPIEASPKISLNDSEVEHLNRSWFQQYATDDFEFKGRFVQLAKTGIKESVQALQEAIKRKDLKALKATGHKLKGTCLAVGLTQLSKLAVAFELLDEFEEGYLNELMQSLLDEVEIVDVLLMNE